MWREAAILSAMYEADARAKVLMYLMESDLVSKLSDAGTPQDIDSETSNERANIGRKA